MGKNHTYMELFALLQLIQPNCEACVTTYLVVGRTDLIMKFN